MCITNTARGFTLIEILITVAILSIGLLGLAGLQLTGLRANHGAYLRSQATILATDIIDRIRANRDSALGGDYDTTLGTAAPTATDCAAAGANCTPTEMAAYDLSEWKQALQTMLPSGKGSVSRTPQGAQTKLRIVTQWDEFRGQGTPTQLTVDTLL